MHGEEDVCIRNGSSVCACGEGGVCIWKGWGVCT